MGWSAIRAWRAASTPSTRAGAAPAACRRGACSVVPSSLPAPSWAAEEDWPDLLMFGELLASGAATTVRTHGGHSNQVNGADLESATAAAPWPDLVVPSPERRSNTPEAVPHPRASLAAVAPATFVPSQVVGPSFDHRLLQGALARAEAVRERQTDRTLVDADTSHAPAAEEVAIRMAQGEGLPTARALVAPSGRRTSSRASRCLADASRGRLPAAAWQPTRSRNGRSATMDDPCLAQPETHVATQYV